MNERNHCIKWWWITAYTKLVFFMLLHPTFLTFFNLQIIFLSARLGNVPNIAGVNHRCCAIAEIRLQEILKKIKSETATLSQFYNPIRYRWSIKTNLLLLKSEKRCLKFNLKFFWSSVNIKLILNLSVPWNWLQSLLHFPFFCKWIQNWYRARLNLGVFFKTGVIS